jgi:hypothetical protein
VSAAPKRRSPSPSLLVGGVEALDRRQAAATSAEDVLERLSSSSEGLSGEEAARRLALDADDTTADALDALAGGTLRRGLVVHDSQLIGSLSISDIAQVLTQRSAFRR